MRWIVPQWLHPIFNVLLAAAITALIIVVCGLVTHMPLSRQAQVFWFVLNFLMYCGIDYYHAWAKGLVGWPKKPDMKLASQPAPTVRHIPADGVIPEGWIRIRDVFRYQGEKQDAMALPAREICIDVLRPGESIDLSVMIREPFQRAKTPGGAN